MNATSEAAKGKKYEPHCRNTQGWTRPWSERVAIVETPKNSRRMPWTTSLWLATECSGLDRP